MSNQSYPISPRLAEQAARDYLAIKRAGLLWDLEREIQQAIEAHSEQRFYPNGRINDVPALDGFRHGGNWGLHQIRGDARRLAELLHCPAGEVEPYLFDAMWPGATTRTIVLDCLRNLANQARKKMPNARRAS
jgi:hypothetical protein